MTPIILWLDSLVVISPEEPRTETTQAPSQPTTPLPSTSSSSCLTGVPPNPYAPGWNPLLSPYYVAEVNAAIANMTAGSSLATKAAAAGQIPNFIWIDKLSKVPTL